MVTYDIFGKEINATAVIAPGTAIPNVTSPIPANPAVQERMRELREKEAAAKADAEKLEQLRIDGIKREVEAKSVEWEAELL
jgi:hypothetical protein